MMGGGQPPLTLPLTLTLQTTCTNPKITPISRARGDVEPRAVGNHSISREGGPGQETSSFPGRVGVRRTARAGQETGRFFAFRGRFGSALLDLGRFMHDIHA